MAWDLNPMCSVGMVKLGAPASHYVKDLDLTVSVTRSDADGEWVEYESERFGLAGCGRTPDRSGISRFRGDFPRE